MIQISDAELEDISDDFYLLDMYADWCGPCKAVVPVLEELGSELGCKVYKMDIDSNETPKRLGVRSIPTLGVFKGGELVKLIVGAHSKDNYLNEINGLD